MTKMHWTERADRVNVSAGLLGEDEWGDLLVPSKTRPGWWDRRYNPRNPTHWRFWLKSRLTGCLVWLEREFS